MSDIQKQLLQTKHAVRRQELVEGAPIVVDSSASMRPFSLAKALAGYGFHVAAVIGSRPKDEDGMAYDWLTQNHPEIKLINRDGVKDTAGYSFGNHAILIGSAGANLINTGHIVDMFNDEYYFGLQGIQKLMHLLGKAYQSGDKVWEGMRE